MSGGGSNDSTRALRIRATNLTPDNFGDRVAFTIVTKPSSRNGFTESRTDVEGVLQGKRALISDVLVLTVDGHRYHVNWALMVNVTPRPGSPVPHRSALPNLEVTRTNLFMDRLTEDHYGAQVEFIISDAEVYGVLSDVRPVRFAPMRQLTVDGVEFIVSNTKPVTVIKTTNPIDEGAPVWLTEADLELEIV